MKTSQIAGITLTIGLVSACGSIGAMDNDAQWELAKLRYIQSTPAAQLKLSGLPEQEQTVEQKEKLKKALLIALQAVSLEYDNLTPVVSIDYGKLANLVNVIKDMNAKEKHIDLKKEYWDSTGYLWANLPDRHFFPEVLE